MANNGVIKKAGQPKLLSNGLERLMPAISKKQQKLMQIAEHHPSEVYSRNKGVLGMSHKQLHEFASGSEKGKPESVGRYVEKDGKKHAKLPHHSEAAATPHQPAHVHHAGYYTARGEGHNSTMRRDGVMDGKRAI